MCAFVSAHIPIVMTEEGMGIWRNQEQNSYLTFAYVITNEVISAGGTSTIKTKEIK